MRLTIGFSNLKVTGDLNKSIGFSVGSPDGKIKKGNPMDSMTTIIFQKWTYQLFKTTFFWEFIIQTGYYNESCQQQLKVFSSVPSNILTRVQVAVMYSFQSGYRGSSSWRYMEKLHIATQHKGTEERVTTCLGSWERGDAMEMGFEKINRNS